MYLTHFLPFFLVFAFYAFKGGRQWVKVTVLASFLQAATPILVFGGGRISGIQPAYALLPIGIFHALGCLLKPRNARDTTFPITSSHVFLFALTVIGIGGAILLPRLFNGRVSVLPPSVGYQVQMLHPTSGNVIQSFYLICNFFLFSLVAFFVHKGMVSIDECINTLLIGTVVVTALGMYQVFCDVLRLPWPSAILNSNLGVTQHFAQESMGGLRRMSSTFLEPSMMSMHLLGMFALFALGLNRWIIGSIVLLCLSISTSATAVVGLALLIPLSVAWNWQRSNLLALCALSLIASALLVMFVTGSISMHGPGFLDALTGKLSSHSGQMRTWADSRAIRTFTESWGLGVGVGSTRSSSFGATFAACTGIPGMLCFVGFFASLISACAGSQSNLTRSLGLAIFALLIGWLTSVPDLAMPMIWILGGIANGSITVRAMDVNVGSVRQVTVLSAQSA